MPSHLQDKMSADENFQLPEHVSLNDVKGNQWADELAGDSESLLRSLQMFHPHTSIIKVSPVEFKED